MSQSDCIILPLGLPELEIVNQETSAEGHLLLAVRYAHSTSVCPACQRPSNKLHDQRVQEARDVPLWDQPVHLRLIRRRFRCVRCLVRTRTGRYRPRVWSEPHPAFGVGAKGRSRRTTPRLRERLAQEAMDQTIKGVAQRHGVGERFVRENWQAEVTAMRQVHAAERTAPRWLGIDDFARRKGHYYDTLLCDLERRTVLDTVEGRDGKALRRWCESLADPWCVEAVSIDMNRTFRAVVELCLPQAKIVADRFHVVRRVGKALSQVVTRLARKQAPPLQKELHRQRRGIGRAPTRWTTEERTQVIALFHALPDLEAAWTLKEAFRNWYRSRDRAEAERGLADWEKKVRDSALPEFHKLIDRDDAMLISWREEILNFFSLRLTNGFVEGKNTKTKAFIRQAYGYRNRDNLRLRILQSSA